MTSNYAIFLILNILATICSNLIVSYIVDKDNDIYSEISSITESEKQNLKNNIIGGFSSQIASFVVFSTDNLLISKFIGISSVGFYGNYTLIVNNLNVIMYQITNSHLSTIGNFIAKEDSNNVESLFKKYNFLNYILAYYFSLMVLFLIKPFIRIWLGDKYLLDISMSYLVSIWLFINSYRSTFFIFIGAYGLYWSQNKKAIFEAVLNILLSLLFLKIFNMGLQGILLGTICSIIICNIWYEPYVIYKYGLNKPLSNFIFIFIKHILIYMLSFTFIINFNVSINTIFEFVLYGLLVSILILIPIILIYFNSEEFNYLIHFIRRIFLKFYKK